MGLPRFEERANAFGSVDPIAYVEHAASAGVGLTPLVGEGSIPAVRHHVHSADGRKPLGQKGRHGGAKVGEAVRPKGSARKGPVAKVLVFRDRARGALTPLHDAPHEEVGGVATGTVHVQHVGPAERKDAARLGVPPCWAGRNRGTGDDFDSVKWEGRVGPSRPNHHALPRPGVAQGGDVAPHKAAQLGVARIGPHAHDVD